MPNKPAFTKLTKEAKEEAEIKQANALIGLLENRYKNKVCLIVLDVGEKIDEAQANG